MSSRIVWPVLFLGGTLLLACTEATPNHCQKSSDCSGGKVCDVARATCISPDAASGPMDSAQELVATSDAPRANDAATIGEANVAIDAPYADAPYTTEAGGAVDSPSSGEAGSPVDTATIDVFEPDLFVPDGAGTCGVAGDCSDPTKAFCLGGLCVGCEAAGKNACGTQVCDATSGKCVECTSDKECTKDLAKGFCVANACAGCGTVGAAGCAARTDGMTTCVASGTAAGQCVECAGDADCKDPSKSFCVANICGGCQSALPSACSTRSAAKPLCSTSGTLGGQCVECSADSDCKDPNKSFCVANACGGCQTAAATACSVRSTSKPVCSTSGTLGGQCVECSEDADCKDPSKSFCVANACGGCQTAVATACSARSTSKPVCSTSGTLSGQCVACQTDTDCTVATSPICNASNACIPCTADSQCVAKLGADPGVCMTHQNGRCATDAETIYVTTSDLQAAVTLMGTNTSKHLIVLRSAASVLTVTNATQVSIVGQGTAAIGSIVGTPGITLSGTGNLYARDLSVIGSSISDAGISAGAGTTLRLERVKVLDNHGGGILLGGAAFDFNDVLVSGNGTGTDGAVNWSGIYVKSLPNAGAATKLNLISVVNNASPGVTCAVAVPSAAGSNTSLFASGNGGTGGVNVNSTCAITACSPAAVGTCGSSLTP